MAKSETSVSESTRALTQKLMAKLQGELQKNAETYVNARVASHAAAKPNQILSGVGFEDHPYRFQVTYCAPREGDYKVYPNKKLRPWRYICLHIANGQWDQTFLNGNKSTLNPPVDSNGHNVDRWQGILQMYVLPRKSQASKSRTPMSTHYLVNRLGDVIASVDLNDVAYHYPANSSRLFKDKTNNEATVGIVLEPCYGRSGPNGQINLLDFSARQYVALAILIKKLSTVYPVEQIAIMKTTRGTLQQQTMSNPSGFIQTFDPGKQPAPTTASDIDPKLYQLRPVFQEKIVRIFNVLRAQSGPRGPFQPKIGQAYRTWAQQAENVALKRAPNPNPGAHNWGLAADIINNAKDGWDATPQSVAFFIALGNACAAEGGLMWGGNFIAKFTTKKPFAPGIKGWDPAHVELRAKTADIMQEYLVPGITYWGTTPDGFPGPGWSKFFALINKQRNFNLATDVFIEKITDPDFSEFQQLATQIQKGTLGQRMAAVVAYQRAKGLKRATDMQSAPRLALSQKGVTNAGSLSNSAGQFTAGVAAASTRSDASNAKGLKGGPQYNFETGLWQDGKMV